MLIDTLHILTKTQLSQKILNLLCVFLFLISTFRLSQMIQNLDRRLFSFPAVQPYEKISPTTLLDSLLHLSRRICGFSSKLFASQRRNSRELIRQSRILLMFFEGLWDRRFSLPLSIVFSFSELHLAFQKILFLLEDCSREGAKLLILMNCQFIASQFRVLELATAAALDVLPLSSLDLCDEVRELVELVRKQARKGNIGTEPTDEQAKNQVISVLNMFEKGLEFDPEFIWPILDYLKIKNWTACDSEIKFLENEIYLEDMDCEGRQVSLLRSLLSFMVYNRVVLFRTGDKQSKEGLSLADVNINAEMLNFFNPEHFRCPISLDVMKDPVIVSTGQTYDRSSIQKWLKLGNLLCPVTGERLVSTELVPNITLGKLINRFFADSGISISKSTKQNKEIVNLIVPGSVAAAEAMRFVSSYLARNLAYGSEEEKNKAAHEIRLLAKSDVYNRCCLVDAGTIPPLLNLLSSLDISTQENAIAALMKLSKHTNGKNVIVETGGLNSILGVLKSGLSIEAKQIAAATIFYLSSVNGYRELIGESTETFPSLMELVKNGSTCGKKNAIVAIFALVLHPKNKGRVIKAGFVPILRELVASSDRPELVADSLAVLAELSETMEGTFAILQGSPLPLLIRILSSSSVSGAAKECCVSLLFFLCKNGGDEVVAELVKDKSLMASLYSLVTEGTSRAGKRACSLINILQDFQESRTSSLLRN